MKKTDCCAYYKTGIDELNSFILFVSARAGKDLYKAKQFKYCPWCGQKKGASNKRINVNQ